jgi:D-alanyl-D-alanine dipeptidase
MSLEKIPTITFPSIKDFIIEDNNEEIVDLADYGIKCKSAYYEQGIAGSYKSCYMRVTAAEMLRKAQDTLPDGIKFVVWDAYRPICIQQRLWNHYKSIVKLDFPGLSKEELDKKTAFFVSRPSYDVKHPSLHNTGGVVDLTLINKDGKFLDMGTDFDAFGPQAWTNHYEEFEENEVVRDNRRLLYWTMINAGFTNLPSEWWHYDFGDKFWAYFTNSKDDNGNLLTKYEGIIDLNFPNRFPIT